MAWAPQPWEVPMAKEFFPVAITSQEGYNIVSHQCNLELPFG